MEVGELVQRDGCVADPGHTQESPAGVANCPAVVGIAEGHDAGVVADQEPVEVLGHVDGVDVAAQSAVPYLEVVLEQLGQALSRPWASACFSQVWPRLLT